MAYTKMNLEMFAQKLKEGDYEAPVNARRVLGRLSDLSEAEKAKGNKMIDSYFGVEAKKNGSKSGSKKSSSKKKGRPAAAVPEESDDDGEEDTDDGDDADDVSTVAVAPERQPSIVIGAPVRGALDDIGSVSTQLRIAEKIILSVGSVMSIMSEAKKASQDVDLTDAIEKTAATLQTATSIFDHITTKVVEEQTRKAKTMYQESSPA